MCRSYKKQCPEIEEPTENFDITTNIFVYAAIIVLVEKLGN
jgi:hypothetical protein